MQTTIDYYNRNAQAYYDRTVSADMSAVLERFAKHVRPGGCIIDIGCGSGRDVQYFRNAGFKVEGIDASEELCILAREATGVTITCATIQDWTPAHAYDGIWANASLLHLTMEEIQLFTARLPELLAEHGVAYMSFKSGIPTGVDAEGRFFTDMMHADLREMVDATPDLTILDAWESSDALNRDGFTWVNMIIAHNDRAAEEF